MKRRGEHGTIGALSLKMRGAAALLRMHNAADALQAALRRSLPPAGKSNFDPSQPRLPRGSFGGGRWTSGGLPDAADGGFGTGQPRRTPASGPRYAQARGGRPGGGRTIRAGRYGQMEANLAQETRFEMARLWAESEIARVRRIDPNWRPQEGLYDTIEGAIRDQQTVPRQANAYLNSLVRRIGDNGGPPLDIPPPLPQRSAYEVLLPGGQIAGYRAPGARPEIYTLPGDSFDLSLLLLTNGRRERIPTNGYPGVYYDLPDRCVIGVRTSIKNGLTIDIVEPGSMLPDRDLKFHRKPG